MPLFSRRNRDSGNAEKQAFTHPAAPFTKSQARRLTRNRKAFAIITSVLFFIALVFLILVQIGNTRDKNVLTRWYLFKIDLSHIQVTSAGGGLTFANSLAQTIGLHDFYQVGLWNFCEGYDNSMGVTSCSPTQFGYWFNPVEIILSELFAGASITLPEEVYTYLNIIRVASRAMFGCFFAGTICTFLCIFLTPLTLYSRLVSIVIGIFAVITMLLVVVAAVISTAMWNIFTNVINGNAAGLGLEPFIGKQMLAFMWVAAGCALIAGVIQLCLMCCCTSRRDVKRGKKNAKKELESGRMSRAIDGAQGNGALDGQTLNGHHSSV